MEITNDLDTLGKLKIIQSPKMNNFTMDSILLASFINFRKNDRLVVDLCSGNGPVGMLLTLKSKQVNIICVEIQDENCMLANKSIKLNKLEDQIQIINENLIDISQKIGKNKYDVITFNPPYFRVDKKSNLNDTKSMSIARHELQVDLEQIIKESKLLLKNTGMICFVHRPERIDEIIILLDKYNFELKRMRFIHPFMNQPSNTVLIEAKKGKSINNKVQVEKPLYIYKEVGKYTDEVLNIMKFEEGNANGKYKNNI